MIGKLTGTVDSISDEGVILDVGGVGYLVQCPASTLSRLAVGAAASLLIEMKVSDDAIRLYGFSGTEEREWFRLLQTVQSVGSKVALAVLSTLSPRDLQRALGDEKKPWEIGKSFDNSAPLGPIHPVAKVGHFTKGSISLAVNGNIKQKADLADMMWSVAEQIAKLSEAFELFPGDIIYSGTPENVGPVVRGDVILCKIDGLPDMSVKIV